MHSLFFNAGTAADEELDEEQGLLDGLLQTKVPLDQKITNTGFTLLSGTKPLDKDETNEYDRDVFELISLVTSY